jgi:excisionase family DNA binding protein
VQPAGLASPLPLQSAGGFRVEQVHQAGIQWAEHDLTGRSVFIEQAMRMLGVSKRTVYYRIREGRLQTIRVRGGSQRVLIESIRDLVATDKQRTAPSRRSSRHRSAVSSPSVSCR